LCRRRHNHDLRHTFASHLIVDLGLDVVQVSRLMGHASPSTTLNVYAHMFDEARHAADPGAHGLQRIRRAARERGGRAHGDHFAGSSEFDRRAAFRTPAGRDQVGNLTKLGQVSGKAVSRPLERQPLCSTFPMELAGLEPATSWVRLVLAAVSASEVDREAAVR
jgi:Phage integrase family